ncbi:MAG: hypothetical protein IJA08_00560 [Clostridia bacterium]|nr:hypothetical protein [Clostridia bacterium]
MFYAIVLDTFILFLLIYALLDLFVRLSDFLLDKFSKVPQIESARLVFVSEGETLLEAKLRNLLKRCETEGCILLAVDDGLGEENRLLMTALMGEYDCLSLVTKEELVRMVEEKETLGENPRAN